MSEKPRRADAERNIAAIHEAALTVLSDRPDASIGQIADAAGVTRQTVYAHYGSREALLGAVADRALGEAVAAIDAAAPEDGAPSEALERLVAAWWGSVERHARVLEALATAFPDHDRVRELHEPILERLERLARRGQRSGDFDPDVAASWLATAFLALMHAAAEDVAAGRASVGAAADALARSVPRLFAATG